VRLTVVIPSYNEAENLSRMVSALFSLPLEDLSILVVDDNSPDGTGRIADELASEYPKKFEVVHRPGKMGLGTAYITGFRRAIETGANAIAQMDMDFSHPPETLPNLLANLDSYDVVMGSRYAPGGGVEKRWPLWRKGLSRFGNVYARLVLRLPVQDATGGFKIWRREALLGIPMEQICSNGYAFQIEMAYLSYRLGYTFKEVPFYFPDRKWGRSKMSLQIQLEAALRVWQMRLKYHHLNPRYQVDRRY
jgi:dolichol-phosphate mannosyltransferase